MFAVAVFSFSTVSFSTASSSVVVTKAKPERCKHARLAVSHYRNATWSWQHKRDGELADRTPLASGKSCHWVRYAAGVHKDRARVAHRSYERWAAEHLLRDGSWLHAVDEVQRVFPGTESWLLSCSDAESNHHHWVGYSGVPYSTWLRDSNTVGGYMQFRFGTFTGMYRAAIDYITDLDYRVPETLSDWSSLSGLTRAWRSALGQALAAGWARYTGNDNSHWSASWDTGCR